MQLRSSLPVSSNERSDMKKKTKLGLAVTGVVLMASIGVPVASAADIEPGLVRSMAAPGMSLSGGYRFVVKYRDNAAERCDAAAVNRGLSAAMSRTGLDRAVAATARSVARPAASAALLRRMGMPGWNVIKTSRLLNEQEAAQFILELKANPAVEQVEIDQMYRRLSNETPRFVPNDPDSQKYQWNFFNPVSGVNAAEAWEMSQGEGVVVAVLDTGIGENTRDLVANVIPGYDMITDRRVSRRDSDERAPGGWDLGDGYDANYCIGLSTGKPHPADNSSWHGTHVAGTIAQETNNGVGLAGLAHKAKVMPIRVLGSCGGRTSDIADGIIWAVGGEVPGMPLNANPAEVLNMSIGSSEPETCPASYQAALDFASSKGAIVVVAAGNDNAVASTYTMSACKNLISVGATGVSGARAGYSNYGAAVDLSAPGGGGGAADDGYIWQVTDRGTRGPIGAFELRGMAGTSMASPHVAAAVAMVQSVVKTPLNWMQMRDLLKATASPFPLAAPPGRSIGTGILNIAAALTKATEEPCDPTVETCGPVATPLINKVAVTGLAGNADNETLYRFDAKVGQVLTVMTYGGWGDVALYASFDAVPTATKSDARSTRVGNSETIRFTAPKAGTYYVLLKGTASYGDVTLVARQ